MDKQNVYEAELAKLTELFADVEPAKMKLVEGLIKDAAFLFAENHQLRNILKKTGMIKIHPEHPELQKQVIAAKEYRQNLNSYAVIIKTLNSILKAAPDGDDDFDEFMKEMKEKKEG